MRLSTVSLLAIALLLTSCAVGVGVIEPGSHRTSTQTYADTRVTGVQPLTSGAAVVTTETSPPTTIVQTGRGPFVGLMVGVHAGRHWASLEGKSSSGTLLETFLELVAGKGPFGVGIRLGPQYRGGDGVDLDGNGSLDADLKRFTIPIAVAGYLGRGRFNVHLGIGHDLASFAGEYKDKAPRLIGGVRYTAHASGRGAALIVLDLDHTWTTYEDEDLPLVAEYRSTGVILGVAFMK